MFFFDQSPCMCETLQSNNLNIDMLGINHKVVTGSSLINNACIGLAPFDWACRRHKACGVTSQNSDTRQQSYMPLHAMLL